MSSVIVLTRNFEYHSEVTIKKVLKWIIKDKIEVVVSHEQQEICGIELRIKMPMVVRLLHFVGYKIKSDRIQYSDHAVFNRDNNCCQYYHYDENGKKFIYQCTEDERTIDHVTPQDMGGETSFTNCVTCCWNHNVVVKKNKLPHQVGLQLIRKPVVPRIKRGDFVIMKFAYNPRKTSHKYYMEKVMNRPFSNRAS